MLDLEAVWDIQFFELVQLDFPLMSLDVHTVPVKEMEGSMRFWPPLRKPTITQRQRAAAEGSARTSWSAVVAGAPGLASTEAQDDADEAFENLPPEEITEAPMEEDLQTRAFAEALSTDYADQGDVLWGPEMEQIAAVDLTNIVEFPLLSGAACSSSGPLHTEQEALGSHVEASMPGTGRAAASSIATGPRFAAEAVCFVQAAGKISFHVSKNSFEAVCNKHKNCVLTRVARPAKASKTVSAAGRPLGFLTSWLLLGESCSSKEVHWDKTKWRETFTQQRRQEARCLLASLPGGSTLAEHERDRANGEPEEPVSLTGFM
eukprot:6465706-Amphidinium_carterae.3